MATKDTKKIASKTAASNKKAITTKAALKKPVKKETAKKAAPQKILPKKTATKKVVAKNTAVKRLKPETISADEKRMMIEKHAYYKWESAGYPNGQDHQHWLDAEQELIAH